MNTDTILQLLHYGSSEERKSFVESCPPNNFKNAVLPMAGSDNPSMVVVAMSQLIMEYCNGSEPEVGASIALATHTYALHVVQGQSNHEVLPVTLSRIAFLHINALTLLGKFDEVISYSDQYIPFYTDMGEKENLPSLKAARINALLNLNRIDEAEQMLSDPELRGNWSTDIEIDRLERKLKVLKGKITDTRPEIENNNINSTSNADDMINILKKAIGHSFEDPSQRDKLLAAADQIDTNNRIDTSNKEGFQSMLDLLKYGESIFTKGSNTASEWHYKQRVREAGAIFALEKHPSVQKIKQSLAELEPSRSWARENGFIELENDALWGIYLCHSRMDEPSLAADALIDIRLNLENTRNGISDPLERGGVFSSFPHLFDALCEKLHAANRPTELLESIEASKGRGIADILTQKTGKAVADASIYQAVTSLPGLTQKECFHYLSYYVDDAYTYAVLVCKDGDIHVSKPIAIAKQDIRQFALNVNPRSWGYCQDWDSSAVIPDISKELSPLVGFLDDWITKGVINTGDHIAYSSDDSFNNVPLHYLKFNGKPLIETFTISKIHNAFHLKHVLENDAPVQPSKYSAFVVPTIQNTQRNNWKDMAGGMYQPIKYLQKHMAGSLMEFENVTKDRIAELDFHHKVVQFSTHGIFPQEDSSGNPYSASGLVIGDNGRLPDEEDIALGKLHCVLTPKDILNLSLDFTGSHVSLMACVSGLSREGLGGDALGLDWAIMQAGASSLLGSHWIVSATSAGTFFERFYDHWLAGGKTRAMAYKDTIADLMSMGGALNSEISWAAFSLTGDWR